jgi:hypothetical protein
LDISLISQFSGVFIAEEVDGIGDKWSGNSKTGTVHTLYKAFLNITPPPQKKKRSAIFNDEAFFQVKS